MKTADRKAFARSRDWCESPGESLSHLIEQVLRVPGVEVAQADIPDVVLDVVFEDDAIALEGARAQFLLAARKVAFLDEFGERQRAFGLRRPAIDGEEDLIDERKHILFGPVLVGIAGEALSRCGGAQAGLL